MQTTNSPSACAPATNSTLKKTCAGLETKKSILSILSILPHLELVPMQSHISSSRKDGETGEKGDDL